MYLKAPITPEKWQRAARRISAISDTAEGEEELDEEMCHKPEQISAPKLPPAPTEQSLYFVAREQRLILGVQGYCI
jgi:hypothetical protein